MGKNSTLREQMVMVMMILIIPLMLFAAMHDLLEYWRLPSQPALLTTAAAIELATQGERPFVQLTDAQWDCAHLVITDGRRSRNDYTKIELLTPITDSLIIVTLQGKYHCDDLPEQVSRGVLQPTTQWQPPMPSTNREQRNVYALCGDCSRSRSLAQALMKMAFCLFAFGWLVAKVIQTIRRPAYSLSPSPRSPSATHTGKLPVIHHPVWLNGKLQLDRAGSYIQEGALLAIAPLDSSKPPENFTLRFSDNRTFLLAGGTEGSVPSKRLLNDLVPIGKAVTLTVVNPDGQSSPPVAFQR